MPPENTAGPTNQAPPAARPSGAFQAPINPEAQRLAALPPKEPVRVSGTRPTPPTNQADLSPQERWKTDQDARTRGDAWLDQSKVLTRDASGNLVQRERTIGPDGEPIAGKPLDPPSGEAGDQEARSQDDESPRIKIGDVEMTEAEWQDLVAFKAQSDLRKAQVPANPGQYKLELPADFKLPEGVKFIVNENDPVRGPILNAARNWAHQQNLTQAQFSEMLGLYASSQSREQAVLSSAVRAEAARLGAAGPMRVDAITMFLRGKFGDSAARPMISTMATAAQVEVWERIIHELSTQGGASFRGTGRVPPERPSISDADYDKMSYSAKVEYARQATARAQSGR